MIDLVNEQRIGLREGTKFYPSFREGRPTHISTLVRHITKGIRLANGNVVRLEGARLGGRWITSVEAVQRFMERLTAGALGDASSDSILPISTTKQRRRQLDRADRALDRAKI
jgi:Protein of unknown function (DUF1580)